MQNLSSRDMTIRVLIVDDHPIVRKGLYALLHTEGGMQVVGEAADGFEAIAQVHTLHPDVILMDLLMPGKEGIEAIREIKKERPESRILVLTSFAEDNKVFSAIKAGASGYQLKDSSPQTLLQSIHAVYRGESSLHPTIAHKLISEFRTSGNQHTQDVLPKDRLTEREKAVLHLIARGKSNREIAEQLVVSDRTVHVHVGKILEKLHLANRTQAAIYALQLNMTNSETG
jgi:two-component system, NarL family, response regulator LiaR